MKGLQFINGGIESLRAETHIVRFQSLSCLFCSVRAQLFAWFVIPGKIVGV